MKTFVRAIQSGRWIYEGSFDNFDILKASSDALTVDMGSLNKELSVYEINENTLEEIEYIAIKVFLDSLRNFQNGITLVVLDEDYIISNGYLYVEDSEENIFNVHHYNVINVFVGQNIIDIANHIGSKELTKDKLIDYSLEDMFSLMVKHKNIVKEYDIFKSRKKRLRELYSSLSRTTSFDELFA